MKKFPHFELHKSTSVEEDVADLVDVHNLLVDRLNELQDLIEKLSLKDTPKSLLENAVNSAELVKVECPELTSGYKWVSKADAVRLGLKIIK